jgi:hypothetical protein
MNSLSQSVETREEFPSFQDTLSSGLNSEEVKEQLGEMVGALCP